MQRIVRSFGMPKGYGTPHLHKVAPKIGNEDFEMSPLFVIFQYPQATQAQRRLGAAFAR
jgi:hypothetical protein